jgi:NDP-sugar pyrophosphorylase family protein
MQAVILAGGQGSRLRPYTTVLPKPLMPIGDYPILEIILRQLKRNSVGRIVLAVGYMSHLFEAFFQDGSRYGLQISYSQEKEPLGTAGPLAAVIDDLDEDFILLNGDLLTTLNYRNLFAYHKETRAAATIGVFSRSVNIDFGVLKVSEDRRLVDYIEKPTYEFEVSMGINVLNAASIRPYVSRGTRLDVPSLMKQLSADGHRVCCYREDCRWLDIGRLDDYQTAIEIFAARRNEFLPDGDDR